MASSDEKTLLKDESNYRVTLQTYLQYMRQLPPQRQWMKDNLGPRITGLFEAKKEIRVLAVGTGSGEVDVDFLNEITSRGHSCHGDGYHVTYQVVEPNQSNIDFFRERVSKEPKYANVKFEWFQGFYETFLEQHSGKEEDRFDFAHFVRCFYHIDSVMGLNTTYKHLLRSQGFVAVVGENENAFWPKQMLFLNEHKMTHECFTCSGPVSQAYFLPGWLSQAKEKGWRHESAIIRYNFDVTPMYDADNDVGNYLMDFAMHVKKSRQTLDAKIIEDFFAFLEANIVDENEDGKAVKFFPCELGAIIITKE